MISRFIIALVIIVPSLAIRVNLREDKFFQTLNNLEASAQQVHELLATSTNAGCVEVFSECNFQGESLSSCDEKLHQFAHDIYSVRVPAGMAVTIQAGTTIVHVEQDLECLSNPLNHDRSYIKISATSVADIPY